jgi:DnaJ-class molecular chaperone
MIKYKHMVTCPECYGVGRKYIGAKMDNNRENVITHTEICSYCKGWGVVLNIWKLPNDFPTKKGTINSRIYKKREEG